MPVTKEFTIQMKDEPGTLGQCCQALATKGINIVAFEALVNGGRGEVRLIVDNPNAAKSILDQQKIKYEQTDVVQVRLPNRPGELGRAAARLGEVNINIQHAYCGIDPATRGELIIFGVNDVTRANSVLDEIAKAA